MYQYNSTAQCTYTLKNILTFYTLLNSLIRWFPPANIQYRDLVKTPPQTINIWALNTQIE